MMILRPSSSLRVRAKAAVPVTTSIRGTPVATRSTVTPSARHTPGVSATIQ